ncbi:hypothetical protein GCM10009546_13730 [Actinomadura livida]|uniref:ArsR family transcriptional regulator n=1 Tax=Actinomadura livida TaxID=79909 RepID=A0ABN1DV00_9ACTN|nr:hypothetical protein GCM10010208_59590 [Actinomadura livida]
MPIAPGVGDVFKALADPTRRIILDELTDRNGQTLFEICARLTTKHQFGSSRQAISQHLDVLEGACPAQTGRFCCSMYWRRTLIGAPPTLPVK